MLPRSIQESIRRLAIDRMAGSSSAIARGWNARATRLRYRVCSGWSAVSIVLTLGYPCSNTSSRRLRASGLPGTLVTTNLDE